MDSKGNTRLFAERFPFLMERKHSLPEVCKRKRREDYSSLLKQAFVSYFAATDLTTSTSRPL